MALAPGPALLLNPPSPPGKSVNREGFGGLGVVTEAGGFTYPAQGLAELQAALRRRKFSVEARDLVLEPAARWSCEQSLVVVRVAIATLEQDLAFARERADADPDARIVLWGTGLDAERARITAAVPRADVQTGFDAEALAAAIVGDATLDIEERTAGDWTGLALGPSRWIPIWHRRGCTHTCRWCPYILATGRRMVGRSPAATASEFRQLVELHAPRRVVFRDPLFAGDTTDALLLLSRLAHLPAAARAPFEVETRPECITEPVAAALAEAGCVEVKLGIETFEEAPLREGARLLPGRTVADYRESVRSALQALQRRQVAVRAFLMGGLPLATTRGDDASAAALADLAHVTRHPWRDPAALKAGSS